MKRKNDSIKEFSKFSNSEREMRMKKASKKKSKSKSNIYEDSDDWNEYELSKIRNREKLEDFFDDDEY